MHFNFLAAELATNNGIKYNAESPILLNTVYVELVLSKIPINTNNDNKDFKTPAPAIAGTTGWNTPVIKSITFAPNFWSFTVSSLVTPPVVNDAILSISSYTSTTLFPIIT